MIVGVVVLQPASYHNGRQKSKPTGFQHAQILSSYFSSATLHVLLLCGQSHCVALVLRKQTALSLHFFCQILIS